MQQRFDKDEIKNSLTLSQVYDLLGELGGDPRYDMQNPEGIIVSRTICHNPVGAGSYKLYYYSNSKLFRCYTSCNDTFDIFQLVIKVRELRGESWDLPRAMRYVASFFGIAATAIEEDKSEILKDWAILKNYQENNEVAFEHKKLEFKEFNSDTLKHFPRPAIEPWIREGISQEVMNARGICYDPVNQGIVIPHYDKNGALIGIRERTLIKEEERYGKYRPAIINGQQYNHPLGLTLYNLNNAAVGISRMGLAIVFEGEKSCLKYATLFGLDSDISVATCGSNLIQQQVDLLLSCGCREIVVAFDKQFQQIGDAEFKQWTKKLKQINDKYSKLCQLSFMFDKENLLDYKASPIDKNKEVFIQLFKERIRL